MKKQIIEKGFIANILDYKDGNFSNGGISKFHKEVTIVSEKPELQIFEIEPKDELVRPIVVIKNRDGYIYAEPIDAPEGVGWMMGGSFIYSCDSRFRNLLNEYPIPLHDRQETPEQNRLLSI